jgi:tetratricopeptide (TPR) repeat protein
LEEGNVFWLQGELGAARGCWSEALAHLRDDPYYIAWVHYNLGIVLQPNQPVQAEPHLLKAEQLSHQKSARKFRSRALCGLGVVRQGLGEWQRALFSYERAILAEGDATDHREALWRKGHLLRMMGQASEALALFQQALDKLPAAWLHADLAAARLMLGDIQGAQRELQQANDLGARGRLLVQVVQAELARQAGQAVWLDSATPGGWLKDEVHCFPRLFAQLKAEGLEVEASLKKGLQVEVRAAGVLQVRVNGREVELPSKPGELLVRLLESEGSEALDFLLDDLYPQYGLDRARRANQALWETADQLRQILGWEDSIQNLGKAYRLDPQTHWEYDIPKLVIPGNHRFLQGVRSRWVRERLVFLRTGVFPD